jgi:hypothetical protein
MSAVSPRFQEIVIHDDVSPQDQPVMTLCFLSVSFTVRSIVARLSYPRSIWSFPVNELLSSRAQTWICPGLEALIFLLLECNAIQHSLVHRSELTVSSL